jgi:crotonobetainyl-CoA:carnitine CoA-transferase CaiB-like acyl-CoA transferase
VAHVLITIFAALAHRDRTGQGSYTEIAQAEAGGAMLAPLFLQALATGRDVWPEPNEVPGSYLSGVFAAAGQDAWLAVELEDASDWDAAAALLGVPELSLGAPDPPPEAAVPELKKVIAAWAQTLTPAQGARQLQAAGLAAAAVQEIADLFTDAGLWARNGLAELHLPDTDVTTWVTAPFQRMQSPRAHVRWPSPHPGQHSAEILRDWLTPQASPAPEPGQARQ